MKKVISTNPAKNYEKLGEILISSNSEIKNKVKLANEAKESWRRMGIAKRVEMLKRVYKLFLNKADDIAFKITQEIGLPITQCKGLLTSDLGYFEWFINNASKCLVSEITSDDKDFIYQVYYEPFGSVAVITPFNLPFEMFVWGVIPNLLVGNTVIYKAAEECVLTGKLFTDIMEEADLPVGVFASIFGDAEQSRFLINQDINFIWFTGSSDVGKKIFKIASKKFIKSILEMGGSNPAIVFADSDIDLAVHTISLKRYSYCGQTCDAVKRLLVEEKIFDEVVNKLKAKVETFVTGDPEDSQTTIGPLASKKQLKLLKAQVKDAKDKGAKTITGGKSPKNLKGAYFLPTILTNIKTTMRVWQEEVFGPVLPVLKFKTEEEAIALANNTKYGLGSQVYSGDQKRLERVAREIKAGCVDLNGANHFKPFNPFGGYKESGMGREHGQYGFHELCQIKLISIKKEFL